MSRAVVRKTCAKSLSLIRLSPFEINKHNESHLYPNLFSAFMMSEFRLVDWAQRLMSNQLLWYRTSTSCVALRAARGELEQSILWPKEIIDLQQFSGNVDFVFQDRSWH
jgi:hypothetical protein